MKLNHDFKLELSAEAYRDLIDIQNYTFSRFGHNQWKRYGAILDKAIDQIVSHPYSGHHRNDIPVIYRAVIAGKHVLIYRVDEFVIYLVRVLHQKMDFTSLFRQA